MKKIAIASLAFSLTFLTSCGQNVEILRKDQVVYNYQSNEIKQD